MEEAPGREKHVDRQKRFLTFRTVVRRDVERFLTACLRERFATHETVHEVFDRSARNWIIVDTDSNDSLHIRVPMGRDGLRQVIPGVTTGTTTDPQFESGPPVPGGMKTLDQLRAAQEYLTKEFANSSSSTADSYTDSASDAVARLHAKGLLATRNNLRHGGHGPVVFLYHRPEQRLRLQNVNVLYPHRARFSLAPDKSGHKKILFENFKTPFRSCLPQSLRKPPRIDLGAIVQAAVSEQTKHPFVHTHRVTKEARAGDQLEVVQELEKIQESQRLNHKVAMTQSLAERARKQEIQDINRQIAHDETRRAAAFGVKGKKGKGKEVASSAPSSPEPKSAAASKHPGKQGGKKGKGKRRGSDPGVNKGKGGDSQGKKGKEDAREVGSDPGMDSPTPAGVDKTTLVAASAPAVPAML